MFDIAKLKIGASIAVPPKAVNRAIVLQIFPLVGAHRLYRWLEL
jgi:hypothetical protein